MDGVIIDSELIHRRITAEYFRQFGVELKPEEFEQFVGSSAKQNIQYIKDTYQLEQPLEYYIQGIRTTFFAQFEPMTGLSPIAGTVELIDALLAAQFQLILASSASHKNIDLVLEKFNITNRFLHRVSGTEFPKSKPHPAIFLRAAELAQARTEECLVIEDSKHGVTAAKAANMKCIGHQNPNSGQQDLTQADHVVHGMTEITVDLVERLLRRE